MDLTYFGFGAIVRAESLVTHRTRTETWIRRCASGTDDPRLQAGRLLDHIAAQCKAKGAAAVTADSDELASFAGEVPLSRLTALESLWKAEAKNLRAGLAVDGGSYRLLPLMDGQELTGLLFIEGDTGVEKKNPAVIALAAALKAARVRPAPHHALEANVPAARASGSGS